LAGEHQGDFDNLYVVASGVLSALEIQALLPFDLSLAKDTSQETPGDVQADLPSGFRETFSFGRKYARPLARQQLQRRVRQECRTLVPGRCRNLHVEVKVERMASVPVLVPVWIVAYRYQGQVYRLILNGQTGKATGKAPLSWIKIILASVSALLLLAGVIWLGLAHSG
jgi:hypothetical protein